MTETSLKDWEEAVITVVQQCVGELPTGAAHVEIDRSGDNRAGFSMTIDIRARTAGPAWIGGGIDRSGEFNMTFGEIWFEDFGHDGEEATLERLRQVLLATLQGRLFQKGRGRTASGWAVLEDGSRLRFGAINGWLGKLVRREAARPYPPYA